MISEEEASQRILEKIAALPARKLSLAEAFNCFAAEAYHALMPLPNFDNSAMDGYAVIAADCGRGTRLHVVGEQPAGPFVSVRPDATQWLSNNLSMSSPADDKDIGRLEMLSDGVIR